MLAALPLQHARQALIEVLKPPVGTNAVRQYGPASIDIPQLSQCVVVLMSYLHRLRL